MKDLIFLPIEIDIASIRYSVDKPYSPTFQGLWQTKELSDEEISESEISFITKQLPYEKITLAKYNIQTSIIPPHVDVQPSWVSTEQEYQHIRDNEPAGYRVVLTGKSDSLEVFDNQEWKKARLPSVPFAYVLDSTKCQHRVKQESGRQTLYFRGFLDLVKHQEIIEKNLEKYRDYAIYSQ